MARILSIDYGLKRCGLATTDPLQIIVNGLTTVETKDLMNFLESYLVNEKVEKVVIGLPRHKDGNTTAIFPDIEKLKKELEARFSNLVVDYAEEDFTSREARDILVRSGVKKSKRQDKALTDKVSAVLILQRYLRHI